MRIYHQVMYLYIVISWVKDTHLLHHIVKIYESWFPFLDRGSLEREVMETILALLLEIRKTIEIMVLYIWFIGGRSNRHVEKLNWLQAVVMHSGKNRWVNSISGPYIYYNM